MPQADAGRDVAASPVHPRNIFQQFWDATAFRDPEEVTPRAPIELQMLGTSIASAALTGTVVGMFVALRTGSIDAVASPNASRFIIHQVSIIGVGRNGFKYAGVFGFFVGAFHVGLAAAQACRPDRKVDGFNFVAAGTLSGALVGLRKGLSPRAVLPAAAFCAAASLPAVPLISYLEGIGGVRQEGYWLRPSGPLLDAVTGGSGSGGGSGSQSGGGGGGDGGPQFGSPQPRTTDDPAAHAERTAAAIKKMGEGLQHFEQDERMRKLTEESVEKSREAMARLPQGRGEGVEYEYDKYRDGIQSPDARLAEMLSRQGSRSPPPGGGGPAA